MDEMFQGHNFDEYRKYLIDVREGNPTVAKLALRLQDDDGYIEEVLHDKSLSEREFIEVIALCRRMGYSRSLGGANRAAENETDSLYARNHWKFVEEFLQNADDCDYECNPEIEITVDERDENKPIVEFVYNERGFTREDVWAITAFSDSTKVGDTVKHQAADGVFYREKTGRKGKGFKSVFAIQADNVIVHIRSNGFSFRLDNVIGRILPIWEDNPYAEDGKTHVTVELINPGFSVGDVYPELRRMFCADEQEGFFARSPLLFMHRLRTVHVTRVTESGSAGFLAAYEEQREKTKYRRPFNPDQSKEILAGIARDGIYYREQLQYGTFFIVSDEGDSAVPDIPAVRYTRMVEDESAYRNYSVFAPLLTEEEGRNWNKGSLFRTFTLAMHPIDMPFAIDAPFALYADRSRIQYNPHRGDEENVGIDANVQNTIVRDELFNPGGVLGTFLICIRSYDGIRMDRYLNPKAQSLFLDQNNSDEHGSMWVPIVDMASCVSIIPVFRLMSDQTRFVSYAGAMMVDRNLFEWPATEKLFSLLLGDDYERRMISDIYAESRLFRRRSIVKRDFVGSMNRYLDAIEDELGSTGMAAFFDDHLYPFLAGNRRDIAAKDKSAFKNLCIYLSNVQIEGKVHVLREPHRPDVKWLHSDVKPAPYSIGRYRVFESSPADLGIIDEIASEALGSDTVDGVFSDEGFDSTSKSCGSWNDARDLIEAMHHFGYQIEGMRLPVLKRYVLSKHLDGEYNAFRDTGVAETIEDSQVESLARFLGDDVPSTARMLKQMGLRSGDDYFRIAGNYLELWHDTIELLHSPRCTMSALEHFENVRSGYGKRINATYSRLKECPEYVLAFLLDESRGLFSADSYSNICDGVQKDSRFWQEGDLTSKEILVRALAGAASDVPGGKSKELKISMRDVLDRRLQECMGRLLTKNKAIQIALTNDGVFDEISPLEIDPLIKMLGAQQKAEGTRFYAGNLVACGFAKLFLKDRTNGVIHVYLDCDEPGDYKYALSRYLNRRFDRTKLEQYEEMERQYQDVAESEIIPMLNRTRYDLNRAYEELERRFGTYSKRQVIGILSWFRNSGYANALGNGSINNEREIEDDYRNEPWKFVYEFIQNVDDCTFGSSKPELAITIDRSVPCVSFDYNELGFTLDDIKALTKFGDSNKGDALDSYAGAEGIFDRRQTGRKGRGFKSVFALPGRDVVVHVRSNGYSFKFAKCLGSIIPIWEDDDETRTSGTRITVEGFDGGHIDDLMDKIDDMLGMKDLPAFFASCPILYLRKLKRIVVTDGSRTRSIDIEPVTQKYLSGEFIRRGDVVSGIAHEGKLQSDLWETLTISVSADGETQTIEAARYSKMHVVRGMARVVSVTSPIIRESSYCGFKYGCLYRTLPLADNTLQVPLAINAPFVTNSGRNAIDDVEGNQPLVKYVFEDLLKGFFDNLKLVDGVFIEAYLPEGGQQRLFNGYRKIRAINLQTTVRSFPILRTFSGDGFVSFANAKVLPAQCYEWYDPERLYSCFSEGWQQLVDKKYANLSGLSLNVNRWRGSFVAHINEYLDRIDAGDEELLSLLSERIYPYLDENYENIAAEYRKNDKSGELKRLKIFAFETSDGSVIREDAATDAVWMDGAKDDLRSFGRYRCIAGSSLDGVLTRHPWVLSLKKPVQFRSAFTNELLKVADAKSWPAARAIIETILYYEPSVSPKIPFLADCALDEELDGEGNVFRDAFTATGDTAILEYIIDRAELESIRNATYAWDVPLPDIVGRLKGLGLRRSKDFFENGGRGVVRLNSPTLSLLQEYCTDDKSTVAVLDAITEAYRSRSDKANPATQLIVTYEDIARCDERVFSRIFDGALVSGDTLSNLAESFCVKRLPSDTVDYAEAYLRALQVVKTAPSKREIVIKLSDVLDRKLGTVLRECKLANVDSLKLEIIVDLTMVDYPSGEIDKALKWLDDDNALSFSYEYYMVEFGDAFTDNKRSAFFVFDETKVLLDAQSAEGCMHEFVRRRYRDNDALFGALVDIIHKQDELQHGWQGTKRQYVHELEKFRKATYKYRKHLVPGYDEHLNAATGNAIDYVLPELLQNINDCKAAPGQKARTLRVAVNRDSGTMLLEYDEAGFDFSNVYSITAFGQSSKHDESEGEKGLGFKKAFTAFDKVEIYSNGFSFYLTAEKSTIPVWIDDSERTKRYASEGKTLMLFTTTKSKKHHLATIEQQWKDLIEGNYAGKKVSPIFLRNIDFIYLEGSESHYSRRDLEKRYAFKRAELLVSYFKLHPNNNPSNENTGAMQLLTGLLTRKKCQGMSKEEALQYLSSLTVEVCIPRSVVDNRGTGFFFSTLPTEISTSSEICLNIPLELTTGRNGIVENSVYNETVLSMVFEGDEQRRSLFVWMLEEVASEQNGLNILDAFSGGVDRFVQSVSDVAGVDRQSILSGLAHARILEPWDASGRVSLDNAYGVNAIICRYVNSVTRRGGDVKVWMASHSQKAAKRTLVLPSTLRAHAGLEQFARTVGLRGLFPVEEDGHDLAIEYLADEYGHIAGGETNE